MLLTPASICNEAPHKDCKGDREAVCLKRAEKDDVHYDPPEDQPEVQKEGISGRESTLRPLRGDRRIPFGFRHVPLEAASVESSGV